MKSFALACLLCASSAQAATWIDPFDVPFSATASEQTDTGGIGTPRAVRLVGTGSFVSSGGVATATNQMPLSECCFQAQVRWVIPNGLDATKGKNDAFNLWIRSITGTWTVAIAVQDTSGHNANVSYGVGPWLLDTQTVLPFSFEQFEYAGLGVDLSQVLMVTLRFYSIEPGATITVEQLKASRTHGPKGQP